MRKTLIFFLLLNFIFLSIKGQNKDAVKITVNDNFNIQRVAENYLGNKNLWTYILKANNLSGIEKIKTGMTLLIPVNKVKAAYSEIEKAKISLLEAVNIGAKILAEEYLNDAETLYKKSIKHSEEFEFEKSLASAKESILFSKRAYKQTKEIRDKTVDAIVSYKKGILQKRIFSSLSWTPAELYDNLREKDIARTLSQSNAQITFFDLSQIKLNENSQAVIQSSRFDPITNKSNSKVKLIKGDAYALLQNSPKKKFDVDIQGIKTKIDSKYFWLEKGNNETKLANYNGKIELEAQNGNVVVNANQGSIIPDGGTPSQPIDLPEPPDLILPADLSLINQRNVNIQWTRNPSANSYWVEISKDSEFKSIVKFIKNIPNENIKVDLDEAGVYYWHVCSVNEKGLPGIFSNSFSFANVSEKNKPFILLNDSHKYIFSNQPQYKLSGKTNAENLLTINNEKVKINADGSFEFDLILSEGKNIFNLVAINSENSSTSIKKYIFYETPEQLQLLNLDDNTSINEKVVLTNSKLYKFNLRTIPFANIEIINKTDGANSQIIADSIGNFVVSLDLISTQTKIEINVSSRSGLKKNFHFDVLLDTEAPEIQLNPITKFTNRQHYIFSGKTGSKYFYINNEQISFSDDYNFTHEVLLKQGENIFEFMAIDEAGNQTLIRESVFFDNIPPQLLDYKIIKPTSSSRNTIIKIKAFDDFELKKFAEVTFTSNNLKHTDFARLNENSGWYELELSGANQINVISVKLEDYFSNNFLYDLSSWRK